MTNELPDIKPYTPIESLDRDAFVGNITEFALEDVSPVVGMSATFIRKIVGKKKQLSSPDILQLLDQDSFGETFVPRSKVLSYLQSKTGNDESKCIEIPTDGYRLVKGNSLEEISRLPKESVSTVVTSTPYWAMRIYKDSTYVNWADGECCPFGHEQTPEGFIRHTCEILNAIQPALQETGSVWWNIMDSYNTRTQIRGNAAEALQAMQGKDRKSWGDHECRRYSAGHSFLKDGEQCLIPSRIAERATKMGFYVKSIVTWAKTSTLPEPQDSRVSRNLEYILHLTKVRTPKFDKSVYRSLPAGLGGRNNGWETDKLSDVWTLPTSSGRDGHGAQFPIALPGRCIALTTDVNDVVLDPFAGAGNTGLAAVSLGRRFVGVDVSSEYLATAERKLSAVKQVDVSSSSKNPEPMIQASLLSDLDRS